LDSPAAIDRTFILTPVDAPASPTRHEEVLRLRLRVVPGLDTDRLVTISIDAELNHFAAARWPDNLPEFSHSLMERSFNAHGWLTSDQSNQADGRESCELNLQIEKFYTLIDSAGQPTSVQIQWDGLYRCENSLTPVRASGNVPVGQKDTNGVVRAYQQGFNLAMHSTIDQLNTRESN
jgi:ABC-type uncharacterized transport system auxiliary subunit